MFPILIMYCSLSLSLTLIFVVRTFKIGLNNIACTYLLASLHTPLWMVQKYNLTANYAYPKEKKYIDCKKKKKKIRSHTLAALYAFFCDQATFGTIHVANIV